jgi:hypothetical protein
MIAIVAAVISAAARTPDQAGIDFRAVFVVSH